jgi:putative peptidoglycan lipid II flippase
MVAIAWGAQLILGHFKVFSLDRLFGQFLTVAIAGGLAVLVYLGTVLLLRIEEIGLVKDAVMAKLWRK